MDLTSLMLVISVSLSFIDIQIVSSNEAMKILCGLTTDKLIQHHGYLYESYNVTTEDGYILRIFRCNSKKSTSVKKRPVIIQHGILGSSDDFVIDSPNQALGLVLADAGYDVWLSNSRGNFYSRKHVTKNANANFSDYWDFSWYEMGIYDVPAIIDHVLQVTSNQKVNYIGYSQGTTSLLVLLSERPEYNDKINVASFMAPIGYLYHAAFLIKFVTLFIMPVLEPLKGFEFAPRSRSLNEIRNAACAADIKFCDFIIAIIFGPSIKQRNDTMTPVFFCYYPSGSSFKQFLHYAQEANFEFFGKYMTGPKISPDFNLSQITAPISVHYATTDPFGNPVDSVKLIKKLKNVVFVQRIDIHLFSHIDFIWGMNAASLVYSNILKVFQKYS